MKKEEPHILVTTSVPIEAESIKNELETVKTVRVGGRTVLSGRIGERSIRLIETGPGLVNTTQSLTAEIETCIPKMILMTGCAGGFARSGLTIGDIAIASEEIDAQLGIEPESTGGPLAPLPFELGVFDGVGIKHRIPLDSDTALSAMEIIRDEFSGSAVHVLMGPFVTVSTITATDERAARLFKQFQPCMENMEGVAGAYVARHYSIPFLEIRCASNLVGKRDRSSWKLELACERSAKAVIAWLKR